MDWLINTPFRVNERGFLLRVGEVLTVFEDFRFHDLRHTFNTNMRKAGVDRSVIMKITGHKTMSIFKWYNTVDGSDAVEAGRRLDEFSKPPAPDREITAILLQGPQH
jgi:integrase